MPPEHALSDMRAGLRLALEECRPLIGRPPTELECALALATTELVANAWLHGRPPVTLLLLWTPSALIIDVADHRPGMPPVAMAPTGNPVTGYGLHFVTRLASSCGWYEAFPCKHVWAAFRMGRDRRPSARFI
jgi:anti-sigma regulatory factor (Ser/Thr protein kinase)